MGIARLLVTFALFFVALGCGEVEQTLRGASSTPPSGPSATSAAGPPCPAGSVPAEAASSVIGRSAVICFLVRQVRHGPRDTVSLESRERFTGQVGYFGAFIPSHRKRDFIDRVGNLEALRGRWVLVRGTVILDEGSPEIVLESIEQLTVLK